MLEQNTESIPQNINKILKKCCRHASFHLNKHHIQAKFNELARWREAVIRILLVYLDYFVSFAKLEIYIGKFEGKIISLKKNSAIANVKNEFLKGVTQNHCLGFLVMY